MAPIRGAVADAVGEGAFGSGSGFVSGSILGVGAELTHDVQQSKGQVIKT